MTTRTLPDTLTIIRNLLANAATIQSFVSSRVVTKRPANPQFPYIFVHRPGGIPTKWGDDHGQIQVDCYGRSNVDGEDFAIAQAAWKVLMEAPMVHPEGVLTDVAPSLPLADVPDPDYRPPQPRYIFGVIATAHS